MCAFLIGSSEYLDIQKKGIWIYERISDFIITSAFAIFSHFLTLKVEYNYFPERIMQHILVLHDLMLL